MSLNKDRNDNQKSPTYSCTWSDMTNCTDEKDLPGEITCRNDEIEDVRAMRKGAKMSAVSDN